MFFKHNNQELKSKKLLSVKNKYDPNAVRFYTGFKIYDALIAVLTCLEPKTKKIDFWQGTNKYKDGTLKYLNKIINKSGHNRKLSLLTELVCFY